jgi:outer membrane protein TolC
VGRGTAYEVTRAELDLETAKQSAIRSEGEARSARAGLNQLMALAEEVDYKVEEPEWVEPETDVPALMDETQKNNPELMALRHDVEAASAAVDYAVADLFPELTVSGAYGYSGSDFPLTWSWSGGPNVTFTLFKGGAVVRMVDQRAAELRAARARVAAREQGLFAELSRAVTRVEESRRIMETAEAAVRAAEENLNLVTELYNVDRATVLELSDARTAAGRTRSDLIAARAAHQTAAALIGKIAGREE